MSLAASIDTHPGDGAAARRAMIDSQLRVSGITEPAILAAMAAVPREAYVPAAARSHAYIDRAIPLDGGRALPAPLVHGMMLRTAAPTAADRALVVSCGSGYLAALVETTGASVDVVDAAEAAAGKPGGMGYSLLMIDGAVDQLPAGLIAALGDGCRIVTGLSRGKITQLASARKHGDKVELRAVAEVGIPVLQEFAAAKSWSF